VYRYAFTAVCTVLSLTCVPGSQGAETYAIPTSPATHSSEGAPPTQQFSVKNTFRNICGFCHENYGRKAAKGPQLMATQLTDEQIRQIVAFIRALRPDVDP